MGAVCDLFCFDSVLRCCASLVAAELGERRREAIPGAEVAGWRAATTLRLDPRSRAACAARVAEFFGLASEPRGQRLGEWAESAYAALPHGSDVLTFRTSGSTGEPKRCPHPGADLSVESDSVAPLFAGTRRVLALVPAHHLYGCTFTAILPRRLGVAVIDARAWAPSRIGAELSSGDCLVAVPAQWQSLARLPRLAPGSMGLSATAPLAPELGERLRERGLGRMVEIYGSSENGAIGWRTEGSQPFLLLPHFRRTRAGLARRAASGEERPVELQDRMVWHGPNLLLPVGRLDEAVQVAGVNVYPRRVAEVLRQHPSVADCAVRVSVRGGATARLEAFVVPQDNHAELASALRQWCADRLEPEARPRHYRFGRSLPTNEMGKLVGW